MRKLSIILAAALTAMSIAACSGSQSTAQTAAQTTAQTTAAETTASETTAAKEAEPETADAPAATGVSVRVGSLKGPTSIGLVSLMEQAANGSAANDYEFTMVAAADELLAQMVSGKLDIALIPANVASVLYNKTNAGISVIDINTLGVLYFVSGDDSIQNFSDLKGKTIYLTGKGATPEYTLNYLLSANGMSTDDVTLEFKSEATEVAALLKEDSSAIAMLPQPFVTVACAQNEALKVILDCTEEWDKLQTGGSRLVTGVTVVSNGFLAEHKDAVDAFLAEHAASAAYTASNPSETAELVVKAGIIEKAPIAQKALPYCNITCITGEEMKAALGGYLTTLFEQNPASVGGTLPADDFYYEQ